MIEAGPDLSRVALYARYSSHLQNPKSIQDQLAECRRHIRNLGGTVVAEYSDAAISGSTISTRPGIEALLRDCRSNAFTAVCTEALDRISRDTVDTARIHKELDFCQVSLITINEGPIGPIIAAFKGTMNAMFLKDLATKVRRGHMGLIRDGRQITHPPYGYRIANRIEGAHVVRGIREIDPEQSPIVRRIYALYLRGESARAIARLLNKDGVPSASPSKGWTHTTLLGTYASTGVLNNPLYKGELVYGVTQHLTDPATAKRVYRLRPKETWTVAQVPHLQIIDDWTWNVVQERIHSRSMPRKHLSSVPLLVRGAMPLTPLLRCSHCKGPVRTIARNRWACNTSRARGKCTARTFVLRDIDRVCAHQLTSWIRRRKEWNLILQDAQNRALESHTQLEAEISDRNLRMKRLIDAVERGTDTPPMRNRILEIAQEIRTLEAELHGYATGSLLQPDSPDIRPMLLDHARHLQTAIESDEPETRLPATIQLAEILDHIDMSAGPSPGKARLRIQPNVISLIRAATRAHAEP